MKILILDRNEKTLSGRVVVWDRGGDRRREYRAGACSYVRIRHLVAHARCLGLEGSSFEKRGKKFYVVGRGAGSRFAAGIWIWATQ